MANQIKHASRCASAHLGCCGGPGHAGARDCVWPNVQVWVWVRVWLWVHAPPLA